MKFAVNNIYFINITCIFLRTNSKQYLQFGFGLVSNIDNIVTKI